MKKLFLVIILAIASLNVMNAQDTPQQEVSGKMIYAELGGPGIGFSFNFDSRFESNTKLGWGSRFGLGFAGYTDYTTYGSSQNKTFLTVPLGVNYVFGKKTSPHTFEVGAGTTVLTKKMVVSSSSDVTSGRYGGGIFIWHASFMYRRQPVNGGFSWRIGFTPLLGTESDLILSAAVGIGYAF